MDTPEPELPVGIDEAYDDVIDEGSARRDWLRFYVEQGTTLGATDEEVERQQQIVDFFCYHYSAECAPPSKLAELAGVLPVVMGRPIGRRSSVPAPKTPIGPSWFPYGSNKVPPGWSGPGMTKKFRQNPSKEGFVWRGPNQSSVRIDRGNPNSPYPSQQVDHVVINDGGRIVGRDGQLLPPGTRISDVPDQAHIPLSEWNTWGSWNGL